jgi:hypothetical protein
LRSDRGRQVAVRLHSKPAHVRDPTSDHLLDQATPCHFVLGAARPLLFNSSQKRAPKRACAAASGQRWEISLPETAWKHSRDDLLTSWGSFFARRGLIPASLKEIADGRQRPVDDERRLLMLLTAAYTGPLTVAKAIQELILPSMGTLDEAVPEKGQKTKKPFRPQAGHRKGMLHHQFPKLPPASAKVPKRRLEVHVLGAASQEETLLASYWPELGLLFPELRYLFLSQLAVPCSQLSMCPRSSIFTSS